ncbi:uncharacterized protein SETTUDRAFT_180628 [Exserohilum turcica Et28A]|uniref:Fungal N-terminal domain-containing protein n=1 Tax=Exserohilum turcicum (strain 28A) TaxID=671987 RepID=R0IDU7_EXST2|nr:uncharacterized protein SETTUDRAFT_180628 [Exserohilum turcica Et28A]EOA83505.1 hypothetical protein SETTUDRAFT_180628 [Exserohilum turcica Et28A]
MAELGALASAVQLADVALRTSSEIRKFLDAYGHSDRDSKSLRDEALSEVEVNVRNLRKHILGFCKSKNATEGDGDLFDTIFKALKGYDADILQTKRLLPHKPAEKAYVKIHWVLKKREAQEVMQRIFRRNSNLIAALEIVGRQQSLRIREDTQNILAKQTASDVATSKHLTEIQSNIRKQEENHAELIAHSKTIIRENRVQQASSNQHHKMLTLLTSKQASRTNRRLRHIEETTSQIASSTR